MMPLVLDQIRERNTTDHHKARSASFVAPWNQAMEDRNLLLRYVDELRAEMFGIGAVGEGPE